MSKFSSVRAPSKATRGAWLILGSFFAFLTARVLLWEVHGFADLTAEHWLTIGALVGAVSSGVWFWRMLWAAKLLTATGLALAFCGATVYCLVGSAGRGDELAYQRNADARKVNDDRARVERDRREAKARYEAALEAETTECATGAGAKCTAKRDTTKLRRTEFDAADVRVRQQPAEARENSRLKRAAEVIAFYRGVDEKMAEKGLALIWPFIPPSVCELLTIVFLHLAFGHGHKPAQQQPSTVSSWWGRVRPRQLLLPAPTVSPVSVPTVSGNSRPARVRRKRPSDVQVVYQALEQLGGEADSNDQLAAAMAISKGEASKRVEACGEFLIVHRVGRRNVIRPNYNI